MQIEDLTDKSKYFLLAERNRKGIVILVNKWDLVEKDHKSTVQFEKYIKEQIAPFTDVPIVFIFALQTTYIKL